MVIPSRFSTFEDELREAAKETIADLKRNGFGLELLSGDHPKAVAAIAADLDFHDFRGGVLPAQKVERISVLARSGRKVLMVGDGLNDAPALAAAHASIAPATAADVGRNAADFVFLRESLAVIPLVIQMSRQSGDLIRQNLAFAIAYNAFAIPIAILGYITPLIAALAMSGSSLIVVANAFRLSRESRRCLRSQPIGRQGAQHSARMVAAE